MEVYKQKLCHHNWQCWNMVCAVEIMGRLHIAFCCCWVFFSPHTQFSVTSRSETSSCCSAAWPNRILFFHCSTIASHKLKEKQRSCLPISWWLIRVSRWNSTLEMQGRFLEPLPAISNDSALTWNEEKWKRSLYSYKGGHNWWIWYSKISEAKESSHTG